MESQHIGLHLQCNIKRETAKKILEHIWNFGDKSVAFNIEVVLYIMCIQVNIHNHFHQGTYFLKQVLCIIFQYEVSCFQLIVRVLSGTVLYVLEVMYTYCNDQSLTTWGFLLFVFTNKDVYFEHRTFHFCTLVCYCI